MGRHLVSTLFITFGCSWTAGVGSIWYDGMPLTTYELIVKDTSPDNIKQHTTNAYRHTLCKSLKMTNLNFAEGGSSNQRQWRYAEEYFGSAQFNKDKTEFDNIVVLHAITSTSRGEFWIRGQGEESSGEYVNKLFTNSQLEPDEHDKINKLFKRPAGPNRLWKTYIEESYDHNHSVDELATKMMFWNSYYKAHGIHNLWVDTFNHHEYAVDIPNLINKDSNQRDILSMLCFKNGMKQPDTKYHKSTWQIDSNRIPYLVERGILNPFSYHPTKEGHEQIAELLSPYIEKVLGDNA